MDAPAPNRTPNDPSKFCLIDRKKASNSKYKFSGIFIVVGYRDFIISRISDSQSRLFLSSFVVMTQGQ